jgi:hypothetical protein
MRLTRLRKLAGFFCPRQAYERDFIGSCQYTKRVCLVLHCQCSSVISEDVGFTGFVTSRVNVRKYIFAVLGNLSPIGDGASCLEYTFIYLLAETEIAINRSSQQV